MRQTEAVIAALEGAHEALLFGSGMAAATSVFLALPPGCHVVAPQVMYWGLRDWLINEAPLFGYRGRLRRHAEPRRGARRGEAGDTKLVWIETPANPLWTITDIAARRRDRARGRRACSRSIRPRRRRCSRGRSRSAPTSSCIRRPSISTAIPT